MYEIIFCHRYYSLAVKTIQFLVSSIHILLTLIRRIT